MKNTKSFLAVITGLILFSCFINAGCNAQNETSKPLKYVAPVDNRIASSTFPASQVKDDGAIAAKIKGLHIATNWRKPLEADALSNPDITSVTLYAWWMDMNPAKDKYDWSRLDGEMSRYMAAGKNIGIMMAAGARSPAWIYNEGVRHFTVVEFNHNGKGKKFENEQPVIYDKAYVDLFVTFIRAMAAHMKQQKYWSNVTHVSINGINRTTAELRLPAQVEMKKGDEQSTDAVALWKTNDYTPAKVIQAFKDITTVVAQSFPNRLLIVPVLGVQTRAFPGIGASENISIECMKWLKQTYPARAAAQFTALSSGYKPSGFILDLMNIGIPVGYELQQIDMQNTTDEDNFKKAVQAGIDANALYIEIYPENVSKFSGSVKKLSPVVLQKTK
ncbi:MAG: beta-galactosidase [Bacteroidia bacterium]